MVAATNAPAKHATEPRRPRYEVVRAFSDYEAGQIIEPGDDWPFNRARQLQDQRYLRPLDQEPDAPRRHR
jgi:hypothetical protein